MTSQTLKRDSPARKRKRVYTTKADIVLDAAERVFLQYGFAGTSMDIVAAEANVSKRTVYNNYDSKQVLFGEVIKRRCANVAPDMPELASLADHDPEDVLTDMAVRFLSAIYSPDQIALYRIVVTESLNWPEIGSIMFNGPIMSSQKSFDHYIRQQVDLGRFEVPDIEWAAAEFVGLIKTNVHMKLLMNQPVQLDAKQIAQMARASSQLFLRGALPRVRADALPAGK
ncbi:TetR/AcrR family transcriptional regulator [Sphingobium sp. CECT 9361]|uniref:TetR/AcrR family transcriptional regulator n=1 Tax=Sphingobium sp. CECT 9361 TaxID=2845384 RepID=UPI001E2AF25C|nr:TetR/AcrR family transcriptional regulator [Sphingobium sp. CECT 9361]CAH0349211.1 hypothetical protein SPH9361_00491 [Sphingobium sp. CECT 9361]